MVNPTALNSETHRNLRVITKRGAEYGEATHIVPVVADELRHLAIEYPVILIKDSETGRFGLFAMLGFEAGENLFLDGDKWNATYVPIHVRRQPFSLSYTAEKDGKPDPDSLIIVVDTESPRLSESDGEPLFDEDGKSTPFLQSVNDMLAEIGRATGATDAFIAKLAEHELIEAAQLEVQFPDGEQKRFDGLYSVNEEKLAALEGEVMQDLYKRGFLQGAWLMVASTGNVRKLALRKTEREGSTGQG